MYTVMSLSDACLDIGYNMLVSFKLYTTEYENLEMTYETAEKMSDF